MLHFRGNTSQADLKYDLGFVIYRPTQEIKLKYEKINVLTLLYESIINLNVRYKSNPYWK